MFGWVFVVVVIVFFFCVCGLYSVEGRTGGFVTYTRPSLCHRGRTPSDSFLVMR